MLRLALLANLIGFSVVVSQPLAYLLFLGRAQRALSAAAYIELRQRINPVMIRRLPVVYLGTIATLVLTIVLAWRAGHRSSLVAAVVALVCLAIDLYFMTRANVPINSAIDQWTTANHPADWESVRNLWFAAFAYRQVVLVVGFVALLVGAVFQS